MRWLLTLALAGLIGPALANNTPAEPTTDILTGTWLNDSDGTRVGLNLQPKGQCSMSIERSLSTRSERDCTYEPFEDRYLVFLLDDQGQCDGSADFEFIFRPELPLITLLVGDAQIYLNRTDPSPVH